MWLLLIPLGVAFALVMLVLGAVALVVAAVDAMPWLLILVGIWLLMKAHRGTDHVPAHAAARPRSRPSSRPAPPRPAQPAPPKSRPEPRPRRELPIDVQVKVEQIKRKADVLLGYADRYPPFSQDLHIVRQTTADYLPRTTEAYLALPGNDDPVVAATGKTALQELREQLQLLDSKLNDIAQDLQRQDLDHLLANRRFLEERFRLRELRTDVAELRTLP
jgi:hypothetical protein